MKSLKRNIGALLISTSLVSGAWGSTLKEEEDILHHGPEMIWRAQASRYEQPHKYETDYIPALTDFQDIEGTGSFEQKLAFAKLKKAHYDSLAISTFLAHEIEEGQKKYGSAAPFFVSFYQRDLIQKQRDLEHQMATHRQEILTPKTTVTAKIYEEEKETYSHIYQVALQDLADSNKPFFKTEMAQTVLNLKTLKEEENSFVRASLSQKVEDKASKPSPVSTPSAGKPEEKPEEKHSHPTSKPKGPGILTAEEQKIFDKIEEKYNHILESEKYVKNDPRRIYHLYKLILETPQIDENIKQAFQKEYPELQEKVLLYTSLPEGLTSEEQKIFEKYSLELKKGFISYKIGRILSDNAIIVEGGRRVPIKEGQSFDFYADCRDQLAEELFKDLTKTSPVNSKAVFEKMLQAFDRAWHLILVEMFEKPPSKRDLFVKPKRVFKTPAELYQLVREADKKKKDSLLKEEDTKSPPKSSQLQALEAKFEQAVKYILEKHKTDTVNRGLVGAYFALNHSGFRLGNLPTEDEKKAGAAFYDKIIEEVNKRRGEASSASAPKPVSKLESVTITPTPTTSASTPPKAEGGKPSPRSSVSSTRTYTEAENKKIKAEVTQLAKDWATWEGVGKENPDVYVNVHMDTDLKTFKDEITQRFKKEIGWEEVKAPTSKISPTETKVEAKEEKKSPRTSAVSVGSEKKTTGPLTRSVTREEADEIIKTKIEEAKKLKKNVSKKIDGKEYYTFDVPGAGVCWAAAMFATPGQVYDKLIDVAPDDLKIKELLFNELKEDQGKNISDYVELHSRETDHGSQQAYLKKRIKTKKMDGMLKEGSKKKEFYEAHEKNINALMYKIKDTRTAIIKALADKPALKDAVSDLGTWDPLTDKKELKGKQTTFEDLRKEIEPQLPDALKPQLTELVTAHTNAKKALNAALRWVDTLSVSEMKDCINLASYKNELILDKMEKNKEEILNKFNVEDYLYAEKMNPDVTTRGDNFMAAYAFAIGANLEIYSQYGAQEPYKKEGNTWTLRIGRETPEEFGGAETEHFQILVAPDEYQKIAYAYDIEKIKERVPEGDRNFVTNATAELKKVLLKK